ncbi:hypothetical protein CSUB01_06148, partial [Colletotrichum sublineola]
DSYQPILNPITIKGKGRPQGSITAHQAPITNQQSNNPTNNTRRQPSLFKYAVAREVARAVALPPSTAPAALGQPTTTTTTNYRLQQVVLHDTYKASTKMQRSHQWGLAALGDVDSASKASNHVIGNKLLKEADIINLTTSKPSRPPTPTKTQSQLTGSQTQSDALWDHYDDNFVLNIPVKYEGAMDIVVRQQEEDENEYIAAIEELAAAEGYE